MLIYGLVPELASWCGDDVLATYLLLARWGGVQNPLFKIAPGRKKRRKKEKKKPTTYKMGFIIFYF